MTTQPVEAEHRITFRQHVRADTTISAAYIAPPENHPDMLVFKDSDHRIVYMVNRAEVLEVQRLAPELAGEDTTITEEDRQVIGAGFKTTSQVMEGM